MAAKNSKPGRGNATYQAEGEKVIEEVKFRRAKMFTYEDLEKATRGFQEESQVGKGSFSCVFKV
ncbi:Serine/threonine-protein kinase-like protein cr4 [Orobanche hederae]